MSLQVMAGKLRTVLQHAIDLVGFGLDAASQVEGKFEPLKTLVTFNPAADVALSVDQAKQTFTRWLVTAQLRDVIEGFKSYLDEVYIVCAVYRLSSKGTPCRNSSRSPPGT